MATTYRYPTIGTNSTPYYLPASATPEIARTDQGYFYIQVYGAQAAFSGPWWP